MTQYHILIVEDDESMREIVKDILDLQGYRTYTAENGQEALEALEWLRANLIVSDIMMPVLDGYEFYQRVRSQPEWSQIPFIFLTAKGSRLDVLMGKQMGADDYLTKPFSAEELLVAVASKLAIAERWKHAHQREIAAVKRTILSTLNHEFRTPLTHIATYSAVLASGNGQLSQADFQEFCQVILDGSNRLRSLVEDFLFLVELETGEAKSVYESRRTLVESYSTLMQVSIARHQKRAQEKGLSIDLRLADGIWPIIADTEYLADAISRLVDNAIKFSPSGAGSVVVSVDRAEDMVRVSVSDHGIGIRPDALEDMFQVLHQVDRDRMEQQGSGSGLAITKAIVTLHGGDIKVESEPGRGSTFTILLPAAKRRPGT